MKLTQKQQREIIDCINEVKAITYESNLWYKVYKEATHQFQVETAIKKVEEQRERARQSLLKLGIDSENLGGILC